MVYGRYEDFSKGRQLDKVFNDKTFKIAINPKYARYQIGLALMVYKCFINQLLEKIKKEEFYSSFKDNIWCVDLADMQLISK